MDKTIIKNISKQIAYSMMLDNGYEEGADSIELDFNRSDSQVSLANETVMYVLSFLEEADLLMDSMYDKSDDSYDHIYSDYFDGPYSSAGPGLHTMNAIVVHLGEGSTLENLKHFVSQLDGMKVSDNSILSGSLTYELVTKDPAFDRIVCGECGFDDYLVIPTDHTDCAPAS